MADNQTTDLDGNDAALCDLLADRLDAKAGNDGKADRLTAYALRLLAQKITEAASGN